jgi:hypothetical protein
MGIINEFRRNRQGHVSAQPPAEGGKTVEQQKILDLSYLIDMMGKVLNNIKTGEGDIDRNRKHSYVWTVDIANVLGRVDTPQWVFMIESMIEWLVDSYTSVQPNGKWELYDFESRMEQNEIKRRRAVGQNQDGTPQIHESIEPRQTLVVGLQLVDVKGEKDLIYEMGRPRKRQENSFDPEVLKEMLRHGPQMANAAPDPEVEKKMEAQSHQIETQAAELEQLRDQMRQNSEIMAGLLAELQSGRLSQEQAEEPVKKPASKTTTRRRKK